MKESSLVTAINGRFPKSTNPSGPTKLDVDWKLETTIIRKFSSLGAGVTKDVKPFTNVVGVPARLTN